MLTDALQDLYIAAIARELSATDRVFVGANQHDVALAAYLARRCHAPSLRIWAGGAAMIDRDQDLRMVGRRSYSPQVVAARTSNFRHAHAFEDVRRPVMFVGGMQIDGRGDANLVGIPDGNGGWLVRGPGGAGVASMTTLSTRFYLITPRHETRVLVDRCAARSVVGDPAARAELGLPAGLAGLITPLATFVPSSGGLRVAEIAPQVDLDVLAERTGFGIVDGPDVRVRAGLSGAEAVALAELRTAATSNTGPRSDGSVP